MSLIGNKFYRQKKQSETKLSHVMHVLQGSEQSAHHAYAQYLRQRMAQAVGITAILGFVLANYFSEGFATLHSLDWQLIALFLPFLLLPLALTFPYRFGTANFWQNILIGVFIAGVLLASYLGISRHRSNWFNQESLTLVTIYIYFLSGLSLSRAVFCGITALLAFSLGETAGTHIIHALSANPYLLVANFVGALGLFYLEWHSRELHAREILLRSDAMSDDLTGTLNRRAIHKHLRRVWLQAVRDGRSLCVLRVDIDNSRELNRRVGHAVGDLAMRYISARLETEVKRPLDAVGRSGTDEFLVVLYGCESEYFTEMIKKLPKSVMKFNLGDSIDIAPLTVSGGAVIAQPESDTDEEWEQFIECMDENLARARLNGGNQIVGTKFEPSPASETEKWNIKTVEMIATP